MTRMAIVRSPLRISFVGGGSDLPRFERGGTVSCAIDKYVYVVAKRRDDDRVILHWRLREEVDEAKDLEHGIVREALLQEGIHHGVEIVTFADVSGVGSGLGSSAATACATVAALSTLKGYNEIDGEEVAEAAAGIEVDRLGRKCGRQDHYGSAIGGIVYCQFSSGECIHHSQITTDYRRFAEQFLLFSPPASSPGRDSDKILADCEGSQKYGEVCVDLCEGFLSAIRRRRFNEIAELVKRHGHLKASVFPSSPVPDVVSKAIWRESWKICGAGKTGHILVAAAPEFHKATKELVGSVWGPSLPWQVSTKGTEVIYVD